MHKLAFWEARLTYFRTDGWPSICWTSELNAAPSVSLASNKTYSNSPTKRQKLVARVPPRTFPSGLTTPDREQQVDSPSKVIAALDAADIPSCRFLIDFFLTVFRFRSQSASPLHFLGYTSPLSTSSTLWSLSNEIYDFNHSNDSTHDKTARPPGQKGNERLKTETEFDLYLLVQVLGDFKL